MRKALRVPDARIELLETSAGPVVTLNFNTSTGTWSGFLDTCSGPHRISLGYFCGIHDCTTATLTGSFDGFSLPAPSWPPAAPVCR